MPRASLNPDKAKQGGGGVEAGNYEVIIAKFQNVQTDFRPNQLNLVLQAATLDTNGERVRGADPVDIHFSFGEKSLELFHPGQAKSPDDAEVEDKGDGVDQEGNTIYFSGTGQMNKSCGAIVFAESLVKHGFPKSVLDRCWAQDFVGLKIALNTLPAADINKMFGLRLNTRPITSTDIKTGQPTTNPVTYKVAEKWLNPTYLGNGTQAHAQGAAAAEKATDSAPKPTDPKDIAAAVLKIVAEKRPGEKNQIKTKQSLIGFFTNYGVKMGVDPKKLSECHNLIKNADFMAEAVGNLGGTLGYDEEGQWTGSVTFAEASA
jgi:hypothetical protein